MKNILFLVMLFITVVLSACFDDKGNYHGLDLQQKMLLFLDSLNRVFITLTRYHDKGKIETDYFKFWQPAGSI